MASVAKTKKAIDGVRSVALLLVAGLSPALAQESAPAGPRVGAAGPRVSVSEIKERARGMDYQIRVKADEARVRAMFDSYAREVRHDFRTLLQLRAVDWSIPILIDIAGGIEDVYAGRDVGTEVIVGPDFQFLVVVRVRLHDRFEETRFTRSLIRALLYEQMLHPFSAHPEEVGERVVAPDWLVHGFDQLIAHKRDGRPSAFYAGYLDSGDLLGASEIFSIEEPDRLTPLGLAIYRASSSALVDALLDQPGGHLALRSVLADLASGDPPSFGSLLMQHFPGFREMESGIEKWWALQIAILAEKQSFEFFTLEETERALDEALRVRCEGIREEDVAGKVEPVKRGGLLARLRAKTGGAAEELPPWEGSLQEFLAQRERADAEEALMHAHSRLQVVLARGFPLYRPLVSRYLSIVERIGAGPVKGVAEELAELEEMREAIRGSMVRTYDVLNHYEATAAPQRSKEFDHYLRFRREMEAREMPRRNDRITTYLDELEREFE